MSSSEVQICNMALNMVGGLPITSLSASPGTPESRACDSLYAMLRDELLSSHPWNFAIARADISAQVEPTPAFGWEYAYTLPADLLRAWEIYGTDAEFEIEGNQLLTDQEEEIYLVYIKQQTTTGRFSPSFCTCLAVRIAAELAGKLKNDQKQRSNLLTELYNVHLPAAMHLNAVEGNRKVPKKSQSLDNGNYSWQTAGRG
jgi:hypothetical protein